MRRYTPTRCLARTRQHIHNRVMAYQSYASDLTDTEWAIIEPLTNPRRRSCAAKRWIVERALAW